MAEAPQPIGDLTGEIVGHFGDTLSLKLRLKCKYQYVHGRIQTIQGKDEDPPDRLMEQFNELEQRLKAEGISPSSVRGPIE